MDRSEIIEICEKYKITNYTINPDGSINVDGDTYLRNLNLDKIPLKFNKVSGDFNCSYNQLTSLIGCPSEVGGYFSCSNNNLTSLVGCPSEVGGIFSCAYNKLRTLVVSPDRVGKSFYCLNNQLTSLVGCSMIIEDYFDLSDNPISIIDTSIFIMSGICIDNTKFDYEIKSLSQEKLRVLFEHGVDYDIFKKDGSINDYRLERLFKDFNI